VTLHVYALAEHPAALPPTPGIDGAELHVVEIGEIDAVVSETYSGHAPASEEAVLAHARVVDELVSANDAVLPGRFTNGFGDENALRDAIGKRTGKLRAALEHVRGNVEIGLRVIRVGGRGLSSPTSSGRDYLTGRLAEVRAAERAAERIHSPLAAGARAHTVNILATPEVLLSAAYLIPRAAVDAFRARVEQLDHDQPELTFVCTGPWPPYSFATVDTEGS
jgi:gas vesicle protein GvpL/GvpF